MLEQLLTEIRNGGTLSPVGLAEWLGTTPQMVDAMLDSLERMGYLATINGGCGEKPCGSCPVAGLCVTGEGITPKIRVLVKG